ncbi:MAG: hypothetical protein ABEI31_08015 [Halodesulfurarchaeum sp.]
MASRRTAAQVVAAEGMTSMREPIRDAYVCEDGWFEVRDDAGPHRWIATRDPVSVRR